MNQEDANIQQAYAAASTTASSESLASISSFAETMSTTYGNTVTSDQFPDQQQHHWESYTTTTAVPAAVPAALEQIGCYSASSIPNSVPTDPITTSSSMTTQADNTVETPSDLPGTIVTEEQVGIMEAAFQKNNHPDEEQRNMIARMCGMTEDWVRVWYENRNASAEKQQTQQEPTTEEEQVGKTEAPVVAGR